MAIIKTGMYFRFVEKKTDTLIYNTIVRNATDYKKALEKISSMGYNIVSKTGTPICTKFIVVRNVDGETETTSEAIEEEEGE